MEFLLGALSMLLISLVAHQRSLNQLNDRARQLIASAHEDAYQMGKKQGHLEAMSVVAEEVDEYIYSKIHRGVAGE